MVVAILGHRDIFRLIFLCPQRNFGRHIVIALSVRPASCPVHISNILYDRNSKFGVWIHLGSVACHFRVTVTLTSDLVFRIIMSGAYFLYYLR